MEILPNTDWRTGCSGVGATDLGQLPGGITIRG